MEEKHLELLSFALQYGCMFLSLQPSLEGPGLGPLTQQSLSTPPATRFVLET